MPRRILIEIVGDATKFRREMGKAGTSAARFQGQLSGGALGLRRTSLAIGAATGALAAFGVATGRASARFENTMQTIVGLSGVAQSKIKGLQRGVLDLAPAVGRGPQELADALYFITSSGIDAEHALGVLEVSAKASAAGLGETKVVADAVTSAMNSYGIETVNAKKATDVLVGAVREGKGEATEFAHVIGNVSVIAAQLGVSYEEVGAALAAQTRLGTDAETAAIQLQQVFSNLLKVTPQQVKAYKSVGLSVRGLQKELKQKGLLETLRTIKEAFKGNEPALVRAVTDIRALRGVLSLIGKQSDQVEGVFRRLQDSGNSLKTAFGAVSSDTVQRFARMKAALQVIAVQLGAAFAPVAGRIASALTGAAAAVSDFIDDLGRQRGFQAKVDIVVDRAQNVTAALQKRVGDAVGKIRWDAVWENARGLGDGLQEQLEQIDFGEVGRTIGDGFRDSVRTALPAAKEIASRIDDAIGTIDFEALGRSAGPGLAAAIVSAFASLLDPAFWARNWDLALSIGVVAFGGVIGRVVGKLAAPLVRLGEDMVLRIGVGILDAAPRLGALFITAVSKLPGLIAKALSPITGVVRRAFGRLGRIAQFTVKVLGLTAVFNAVGNLLRTIKGLFEDVLHFIERWAIRVALKIIEPFTHLPSFLGDRAREAKERLQRQLSGVKIDAPGLKPAAGKEQGEKWGAAFLGAATPFLNAVASGTGADLGGADRSARVPVPTVARPTPPVDLTTAHLDIKKGPTAETRNKIFDAMIGRLTDRVQDIRTLEGQIRAYDRINALLNQRIAKTKDATRKLNLEGQILANQRTQAQLRQQLADDFIAALTLGLDKAEVTVRVDDDLAALAKIEDALKKRIAAEGATLDLQRQLFDVQNKIAQARVTQRSQRQFRALGLTLTGEEPIPGVKGLRRQLGQVEDAVGGTFLDTKKTTSLLKKIRKVLAGGFGAITRDVRQTVSTMLTDIQQQLKDQRFDPTPKFRKANADAIIAGLGLSAAEERVARARLSRIGVGGKQAAAGTGAFGFALPDIVVHNVVTLDGKVVERNVTRNQQTRRKRSGQQRRGPNAG